MSEERTRADLSLLNRLFSRWGPRYIWRAMAVAEMASVPAAGIGLYYVLATVPLSQYQVQALLLAVALLVSVANVVAVLYALRITRSVRAVSRVEPDERSEELEGRAWREVTSFPWRFSLFATLDTLVLVIVPIIVWAIGYLGLRRTALLYLITGGSVATVWITIYYYFVTDWFLWPVRRALMPRSPSVQRRYLAGAGVQARMLVIYTALAFTALLMIVTMVYRKSNEAIAPGANPVLALRSLQGHAIFISLLALSLTVIFSLLLARSVANPVQRLATTMAEVERGSLGRRAELLSTDEIGHLTIAFNQMVSQLEAFHAGLEEQVAQRTAELARRTEQLEAAAYVARQAAEFRDVDALLGETVRLISNRFGFYHAGIFLVDEAGEYAVLRAASSEGGQRMLARDHRLAVGKVGIVGYVAGTGKPRIALDVGADAVFFDNPDLPLTRSEMALPLKVGDRVVGVLDVQSEKPAAFTGEDVAVLQTMADQIALAIENARLLGRMQQTVEELERLYGEYTQEAWRSATRRAEGWWGFRYRHPLTEPVEDVPEEARRALLERRSAVYPIRQERDGQVIGTLLAVPVRLRGQVIGVLNIRFATQELPLEAKQVAEEVADRLALALENARLLEETRQRAVWEQTLSQITDRIRAEAEIDAILERALEELGRTLGAERAFVQLTSLAGPSTIQSKGDGRSQEVLE